MASKPSATGQPGDFDFLSGEWKIQHRQRKGDGWINSKSGVLTPPPSWGSFIDGVGIWDSDEVDGEKPIIVRGVWDQITKTSCRWYQAVSRDGGSTWEELWIMEWTRV